MDIDFSGIAGHAREKRGLQVLLAAGRVHAVVLAGPEATPKRAFADAVLSSILGVARTDLARSLDVVRIAPAIDEKTGEKKSIIPIEAVITMHERLILARPMGAPLAVLIEHAECLNANAQNALLKDVEDPPSRAFFLFLVDDPARLLPTLRSRFAEVTLVPEGEEIRKAFESEEEIVKEFLGSPSFKRLLAVGAMTKGDVPLMPFLSALTHTLHHTWTREYATMTAGERERYLGVLEHLREAPEVMRANANTTLMLESIALALNEIV